MIMTVIEERSAKDLTLDEHEELSLKKRAGKTKTEKNLQVDSLWQNYILTSEIKEEIRQNFVYDQTLFNNFPFLIDSAQPPGRIHARGAAVRPCRGAVVADTMPMSGEPN